MIRLAANLSFLFTEHEFLVRFEKAAAAGFTAVEYLFPYAEGKASLKSLLQDHNLTQALFNLYPGDWEGGERGLAALPGREDEFAASVDQALDYAAALNCKTLHVMSGLRDPNISQEEQLETYLGNLSRAADIAAKEGITLTIEPINGFDMPGYFLDDFEMAAKIVEDLDHAHLRLQFDFYHCQRIYGQVMDRLVRYLPLTQHIQLASPPHRNEPGVGDLDYAPLLQYLEDYDYPGFVGCEYKPATDTLHALGWAGKYLGNA